MRVKGIIKVIATLIISYIVIAAIVGIEIATITILLILLYAWIGEYISLLCNRAISMDKLNNYERDKLERIKEIIVRDVKRVSGEDISNLKLHMIPSNQINAMAYGMNNVSFTQNALNSCDEMTLCAILGHEVSHILNFDAVFNRIIFGDITFIIITLMIVSSVSVIFIWCIFLILVLFGICRGVISVFITSNLSRGIKAFFEIVQRGILFIYQVIMGAVSRSREFRADRYSVDLGYGMQLEYFLTRFIDDEYRQRTLTEILYASHPISYQRIQRIQNSLKIDI